MMTDRQAPFGVLAYKDESEQTGSAHKLAGK